MALFSTLAMTCSIGLGRTSAGSADQVEEDWQIVIASPSSVEVGPQITTCMSPSSDSSNMFFAFNLNYRDANSFQPGGLEVKVCSGGAVPDSSSQGTAVCQTSNETISWTQRMSIASDNTITYAIVNGQSTTWGQFGQSQGLDPVNFSGSVSSLDAYSPDTSAAKSGAGWQSDRVSTMVLKCVRYYRNGVLLSTDSNSRSVTLTSSSSQ
jgi:hypothetical protein